MIIKSPEDRHIPNLRQLWQQAFGDTAAFLDGFFATGFAPDRCRCVLWEDRVLAAHYWFDCTWHGKKIAYLYAVATDEACRGQGLCRALVENTHLHLKLQGYAGTVLVPGTPSLAAMYEKLGYQTFLWAQKQEISAGVPLPLTRISAAEYNAARNARLPENAVSHSAEAIAFLATYCDFYKGPDFLLAAAKEENTLHIQEYLGDPDKLPGITAALDAKTATLRLPGGSTPFGMFHSLTGSTQTPTWFGIALD